MGVKMSLGREIESIRKSCNLSIVDVCNILHVTENEYHRIVVYNRNLTTYQLIMFICATHVPLKSI